MKKYPVKYRPVRDYSKTRCVHCGKWMIPYIEKKCLNCGKVSLRRAPAGPFSSGRAPAGTFSLGIMPAEIFSLGITHYCDDCHSMQFVNGAAVCPLCGSKQRTIVELRSLEPENLTAFAHLLHEGIPSRSIRVCREICRGITADNPYRLNFSRKESLIRPFIQEWKALGGTAAACLPWETSRRPFVIIRSYNAQRTREHAGLLYEAIRKSDLRMLTKTEIMRMLYRVNKREQPIRIRFISDFNRIEAWVAAWRKLGGTAVRSMEHML